MGDGRASRLIHRGHRDSETWTPLRRGGGPIVHNLFPQEKYKQQNKELYKAKQEENSVGSRKAWKKKIPKGKATIVKSLQKQNNMEKGSTKWKNGPQK